MQSQECSRCSLENFPNLFSPSTPTSLSHPVLLVRHLRTTQNRFGSSETDLAKYPATESNLDEISGQLLSVCGECGTGEQDERIQLGNSLWTESSLPKR